MARSRGHIDYVDRRDILALLNGEFARFDSTYVDTKRIAAGEVDELSDRLQSIQKDRGIPLFRSARILDEATWLLHYTADWGRLHRRLHDLERSLREVEFDAVDQRSLVAGPDGGFGAGTTTLFAKLEATADALQRADAAPPAAPLFLKPLLRPERLLAYLHDLLVSDIARVGLNQRLELGSVESSILQFLRKPVLRATLLHPVLWDGVSPEDAEDGLQRLDDTFSDFIDQSQHPRTGYWGPWYRVDDGLIKLHDLSYTFHIVQYRKGAVDRWPAIIETTLAIRGRDYPYGWRPSNHRSPFSNHHNMDVIRLFESGFDKVDLASQGKIATAVFEMLDWCLFHSLTPSFDDFVEVDDIDTVDRYAFGIAFLRLAGYWDGGRFWWDLGRERPSHWPDRRQVAPRLLAAVERLNSDSSYVDDIRATLRPLIALADDDATPSV